MMGDFLADVDSTAFAWLPVGTPEDNVNVIFYEYLRWCQEDFASALVCIRVGLNGVPQYCFVQRWIQRELLIRRETAVSRCDRLLT